MSPESTIDYYQRINAGIRSALGAHHSARMLIYSADLEQVFTWMGQGDDRSLGNHLAKAALGLEAAGAKFVVMACNTAHRIAPQLEDALRIPFVHIADVLGEALRAAGCDRVGLLASQITAESTFYRERLEQNFGIEVVIPCAADCLEVDRVIREELCFHDIRASSRERFASIAENLKERGANAIALACTEIGLLIETAQLGGLPVFDTTALHTARTVDLALNRLRTPLERAA